MLVPTTHWDVLDYVDDQGNVMRAWLYGDEVSPLARRHINVRLLNLASMPPSVDPVSLAENYLKPMVGEGQGLTRLAVDVEEEVPGREVPVPFAYRPLAYLDPPVGNRRGRIIFVGGAREEAGVYVPTDRIRVARRRMERIINGIAREPVKHAS